MASTSDGETLTTTNTTVEVSRKQSGIFAVANDSFLPFPSFFEALPKDCRLYLLTFLGQEELYMKYVCLSKQCNDDAKEDLPQHHQGEINCRHDTVRFLTRLSSPAIQKAFRTPRTHLKLVDHQKLRSMELNLNSAAGTIDLDCLVREATLPAVTSLDMSIPSNVKKGSRHMDRFVTKLLSSALPNLRHVDMSNLETPFGVPFDFYHNFQNLETIRWNDFPGGELPITGDCFGLLPNLRSLYLENVCFHVPMGSSRDGNVPNDRLVFEEGLGYDFCILYRCPQLEHVSLVGSTYTYWTLRGKKPLPQSGLIKFVRMTPSLRWFRSDLTPANVAMLQEQRPNIIFDSP